VFVSDFSVSIYNCMQHLSMTQKAVDNSNNNFMVWLWPLKNSPPLFPDEPGCFGTQRVTDVHTGTLFCIDAKGH
jgi:hypothetical protein